jgi:hypothetical protein
MVIAERRERDLDVLDVYFLRDSEGNRYAHFDLDFTVRKTIGNPSSHLFPVGLLQISPDTINHCIGAVTDYIRGKEEIVGVRRKLKELARSAGDRFKYRFDQFE